MFLIRVSDFRPVLAGFACAALAFSYALATQSPSPRENSASQAPSAQARGVGSGLRFSNPFLLPGQDAQFPAGGDVAADPDGFDLGDACFGSQVVRYLSGLNGVQPYRFASDDIGAGASGLALPTAGRVNGTLPSGGTSTIAFNATLTDAAGIVRSGTFRIFAMNCAPGEFRFALDRLPAAQVGLDYITKLEVLGADAGTTITVAAGSIQFNGAAVADLETLGLTLFADGTLAGRPLAAGALAFTARATRGSGQVALNRAGAAPDQPLVIAIGAQQTVQSILGIARATVKINRSRPGRDSLDFFALVNTDGRGNLAFAGRDFTLRFAGRTFTTRLDGFGEALFGDLRVRLLAPDGLLKVRLSRQDFTSLLGTSTSALGRNLVVQISLGDLVQGTEAIAFNARSRSASTQLQYKLGRNVQLGGLFQLFNVNAADFSGGTAFRARFLISNVQGNAAVPFGSASQATVRIGPAFTDTIALFGGRGIAGSPGVRSLVLVNKRKQGVLTTYALPRAETGIEPAFASGGRSQTFLLGLDTRTDTQTFSGESARQIFPFVLR